MVGQSIKANQQKESLLRLILLGRMDVTSEMAVGKEGSLLTKDRSQLGVLRVLQ